MLKDIGVIVPKIREQDRFLKRYSHSIRGCSHNNIIMFFFSVYYFLQCLMSHIVPYSE